MAPVPATKANKISAEKFKRGLTISSGASSGDIFTPSTPIIRWAPAEKLSQHGNHLPVFPKENRATYLLTARPRPSVTGWTIRRGTIYTVVEPQSKKTSLTKRRLYQRRGAISTISATTSSCSTSVSSDEPRRNSSPTIDRRNRSKHYHNDESETAYVLYRRVHSQIRQCGVCGAAFLWLKRLIVPRGVFGKGRRAHMAEGIAFLVYIAAVSISINWIVVAAFLYFNTGWLGNLSTTFATYRSLEAPSVTICSVNDYENFHSEWHSEDLLVRLTLRRGEHEYTANSITHKCPRLGYHCQCVSTFTLQFFDENFHAVPSPVALLDDTSFDQVAPDSLHLSFYKQTFSPFPLDSIPLMVKSQSGHPPVEHFLPLNASPSSVPPTSRQQSYLETVKISVGKADSDDNQGTTALPNLAEQHQTESLTHDIAEEDVHRQSSTTTGPILFQTSPLVEEETALYNIEATDSLNHPQSPDNLKATLRVGIYDSKLMPEHGDTPTWMVLDEQSDVTVALSLVRSWVIDPYRVSFKQLFHGEFAHGEHTFLVDLHRIAPALVLRRTVTHYKVDPSNPTKKEPVLQPVVAHTIDEPYLRIHLSYASYTVVEVWRVGVSFSVALMGLAAICFSAFNKIFIVNTLFPYYDTEYPQKLVLSPVAKALVCGCFGSNHKNVL